jgi:hypothetical protein
MLAMALSFPLLSSSLSSNSICACCCGRFCFPQFVVNDLLVLRSSFTIAYSLLYLNIPSALQPLGSLFFTVLSYTIPPLVYLVGTSDSNSQRFCSRFHPFAIDRYLANNQSCFQEVRVQTLHRLLYKGFCHLLQQQLDGQTLTS